MIILLQLKKLNGRGELGMQIKAYKKSIAREILSSKARFISILIIIFLGVAFYSGIKSAGPDMNKTINNLYNTYNLMDSKIVSSLGLNDEDIEVLRNNDEILDFYGTRSIDANLANMSNVVRFMEYDNKNNINNFSVVEGRLPEKGGEIALDEQALKLNKNMKIGDKFVINTDEDIMKSFKRTTFEIVGIVRSPMYIEKESRGITPVGKGTIDYFAVLNSSDISMDVYTEIYVRFKNVQGLDAYSDEYKDKMEKNTQYLENLYSNRTIDRVEEVKTKVEKEFDKAYKEIEDNEIKLLKAQREIEDGKERIKEGKKQYNQGLIEFQEKIKDGEADLSSGEKKLEIGQAELNKEKEKFEEGKKQLYESKVELDKAKKEFLNQGINPEKSVSELEYEIENLRKLFNSINVLSSDIKYTVKNIKEGEEIPSEKIQYWKSVVSNLGLSDMAGLINELERNPKNLDIAINIYKSLDAMDKTVNDNMSNLQLLVAGITEYQQGKSQYEKQLEIFNNSRVKLEEAQKQLDNANIELLKGAKELEEGKIQGEEELDKSIKQLNESEQKLIEGEKEINKNKEKLLDARKEVEKKEKENLKNLDKNKYYFFDRNDNPGYSGYKDSVNALDNIASVFPVFFFLLAVLICLTTMTRMVEENRIEIGTLKALGYDDLQISWKFIIYAAIASISGCILGILIGCSFLPVIISNAYGSLYSLPKLIIYYYPSYIIQSMVISILCTVGAALFVIRVELKSKPANLMKAKAPKLGKKIFLEKITLLWKALNFNQKVTLRNIFRYKQRMVMTVLGIAGCMAILVTGFGLKNSNTGIIEKQFSKLWKYEAMVVLDEDSTKEDYKKYEDILNQITGYENNLNIHQESVTFSKEDMNKQTVTLYVPQDVEKIDQFILLNDRVSGEKYKISDDGVIINEKLARLLGASAGDTITMKDEENNSYDVKVDKIVENYIMHYMYMSPSYYEKIFDKKISYNTQLLNFDKNEDDVDEISSKLLGCDNVINVTSTSQIQKSIEESTANMNIVMLVMILAAGCLAFVVLYNLNNINVSERIRELSTIKVLGFFDNEVTMYILRESIILTLLGVLTGSFLGKILHAFIISTAETDTMMMYPNIFIDSYIFSALITILFSLIVMIMMHIKLKNINMIDALKSNE